MSVKSIWIYQVKALLPVLICIYVPLLLALLALTLASQVAGISVSYFTRDPSAIMGEPFYIGLLSNLGILLWCSSAAICLFSFVVFRGGVKNTEITSFFLFSSVLTIILLFDDFFLIHESVFPDYLNISENFFYVGYVSALLAYLARFRKTIFKTEFLFLLLALNFFGLSIFIDLFQQTFHLLKPNLADLIEDGCKLLGIVSWCTYLVRESIQQVKSKVWVQEDLYYKK
ncbi:hypothetical protein [Synechocystis sp. PCC 7509]|uniref:hypothetical protein n=1 Tax=Synechocystis sp. PCC 7509 TaxID=927677 RepID=UPI0002ACECCB|nr:hypothetical protein [Synechocystis sp. PCC 7509]